MTQSGQSYIDIQNHVDKRITDKDLKKMSAREMLTFWAEEAQKKSHANKALGQKKDDAETESKSVPNEEICQKGPMAVSW